MSKGIDALNSMNIPSSSSNKNDEKNNNKEDLELISLDNVHKIYDVEKGAIHALADLSFSVSRGEFLVIVGPSGCGKSTLLKIISGLLAYEKGEVLIDGSKITEPIPNIGMVFQKPVLFEWLTVIENVLAPIKFMNLRKSEFKRKAQELLSMTKLDGFADSYPNELSGGMQQRVSICRSLIYDPSLLLMDEPFGALDAMTRDTLNLELLKLWRQTKKTIIFVTHSIQEAVFLADRVIVLSDRPASVKREIEIDLDRPRDIDIKGEEEYGRYTVEIYDLLRSEFEE